MRERKRERERERSAKLAFLSSQLRVWIRFHHASTTKMSALLLLRKLRLKLTSNKQYNYIGEAHWSSGERRGLTVLGTGTWTLVRFPGSPSN